MLETEELVHQIRTASDKKINDTTQGMTYKVQPANTEDGNFVIRTYFSVKDGDFDRDVYAIDMDAAQVLQFAFVGKVPVMEAKRAFLVDYIYHNTQDTGEEGEPLRQIHLPKNFWKFKELIEDAELADEDSSNTEDNE